MSVAVLDQKNFPEQAECLLTLKELDQGLNKTAQELNDFFKDKTVTLISIMNGALVTAGHLLPKLNFSLSVDYAHVTRYRNGTQGHALQWRQKPNKELKGQVVLLVDDIFDQGLTLAEVKNFCLANEVAEVYSLVLLDKQHSRKLTDYQPDFSAFSIPDHYVFGFGLDYQGFWRNAPGIYALKN